jgi:hypothetical protein
MPQRRFQPPWTIEETDARFIVRDANGQALAYVHCEDEAAAHLLTRDEARRIAANIAKLPQFWCAGRSRKSAASPSFSANSRLHVT